jgi:hypothetical protein
MDLRPTHEDESRTTTFDRGAGLRLAMPPLVAAFNAWADPSRKRKRPGMDYDFQPSPHGPAGHQSG